MTPEPTIQELLDVASKAVIGSDKVADYSRGADYEALSGPNAILWSRQAQRDTDLFRSVRFNDASGEELRRLVKKRYSIDRVEATRGTGQAVLTRPSTAAGAGTIWQGTRIKLSSGPTSEPRFYRVRANTDVVAASLSTPVNIEAVDLGSGTKATASSGLSIEDSLWDSTWTVQTLVCVDGSDREADTELQARVRRERIESRVGHPVAIIKACKAAGASQVAAFRSDFGGLAIDYGLNFVYVGDLSYSGTENLVRSCTAALHSVRVAGDQLQVRMMTRTSVIVDVDIILRDSPAVIAVSRLEPIHRRAIIQYFDGANGRFSYSLAGLEAAIARPTPDVQQVNLVTPAADVGVLVAGQFPSSLNRYYTEDSSIFIRYHAP